MRANEHLHWLEKNNLLGLAKSASVPLKKVFTDCLAAKEESILIIGDKGSENKRVAAVLSAGYYLAAKELGLNAGLIIQDQKAIGDRAGDEVIDSLYNLSPRNIIILSMSEALGSIGQLGSSFRSYAKENKHRFISALSLGQLSTEQLPSLISSIDVDYKQLAEKALRLKGMLDAGKELHITTEAGTDLYMNIEGKVAKANVGYYREPCTGGNIPAGEVYMPPKWKGVEGTVVIDGSSAYRGGTQLIKTPIKLTIKKDEVIDIQGGEEAKKFQTTLDWATKRARFPWGIRRVGEMGIGINDKASIVGATIVDEKTLGTAHIALGSNYWFGGTIYAIIHLDQIFRNPRIELDGELLEIK